LNSLLRSVLIFYITFFLHFYLQEYQACDNRNLHNIRPVTTGTYTISGLWQQEPTQYQAYDNRNLHNIRPVTTGTYTISGLWQQDPTQYQVCDNRNLHNIRPVTTGTYTICYLVIIFLRKFVLFFHNIDVLHLCYNSDVWFLIDSLRHPDKIDSHILPLWHILDAFSTHFPKYIFY
jgi:hypothetical protein